MAENVVNDILKWLETQLQRNEGIKIDTIANKSGYSILQVAFATYF